MKHQIELCVLLRRAIAGAAAAASAKSTEFGEVSTIGALSYRFRVLSRIGFLVRP